MPIDAYSLCPGGTGKKIKFCCSDFHGELNKIDRFLEGEQYMACLQHIDHLLEHGPQRACLLATKGMLLRGTQQFEAAEANAAVFLEQHPSNPVAHAEAAVLVAIDEDVHEAVAKLQRALEFTGEQMEARVYEAIGVVAEGLLHEGQWLAAQAHWHLQVMLAPDDRQPVDRLVELNRMARVPLVMKGEARLVNAPQEAPWKERFNKVVAPLGAAHWQQVADQMAALAEEVPDAPALWQDLAVVRSWLADGDGCVEALRKYAALEVPLDDAVEAELLAMLLGKDPLGDAIEVRKLTWTVQDPDRLQEALLSDPRVVQIPFNRSAMAEEDSPPPRLIAFLLDRCGPPSAEGLTLEQMPRLLGQAMFYGRQTDREARLEVLGIAENQQSSLIDLLDELAGDALEPQPQQEVMVKTSAGRELLQRKWHPPRDIAEEQLVALAAVHQRAVLLEQWPAIPLGLFGGKSPREAATDPAQRIKLLAAIMLLEWWCEDSPVPADFDELRSQLGLPPQEAIDPEQTPLHQLPLVRLPRLMIDKLSDDALLQAMHRAMAYRVRKALAKFAQAVIDRPGLAGRPERLHAYTVLAQTANDPQQALEYVEQGRRGALALGQSCASSDFLELSLRFGRNDGPEVARLLQHIQQQHMQEKGVPETLTHVLIEMGVLRPDGTPVSHLPPQESMAAAESPAAEESGKLWTPDSQQSGGGGKLWTPG